VFFGKTAHREQCTPYLYPGFDKTSWIMKFRLALALIVFAAVTRLTLNLLPTPPHNFSPIAAMGLFGAAYLNRRWMAVAVPFLALFLSDLFLNNVIYRQFYTEFTWITSVWIYAAFALVIVTGWVVLRQSPSPRRILVASLMSSAIFFLVTNYSVWAESMMYPKNMAGLLACYTAGLPFLTNTILGDLFFSAVLFGAFQWATTYRISKQVA
jgi:hypothetical protein